MRDEGDDRPATTSVACEVLIHGAMHIIPQGMHEGQGRGHQAEDGDDSTPVRRHSTPPRVWRIPPKGMPGQVMGINTTII